MTLMAAIQMVGKVYNERLNEAGSKDARSAVHKIPVHYFAFAECAKFAKPLVDQEDIALLGWIDKIVENPKGCRGTVRHWRG